MSDLWSQRLRALPWAPPPRYPQLAAGDKVVLDVRRHPITLGFPALRTVIALLVLLTDVATLPLLVSFALTAAVWAHRRLHSGVRMTLVIAGVPTVLLLIASGGGAAWVLALGLVLWLLEDVADWYTDRLVVTRKRIYRLYGVFTTHSPSMALTSVTFIDALESPVGRILDYGTILLDSVAQRDEPLSRFDHLPGAQYVHVKILELRARAASNVQSPGPPG